MILTNSKERTRFLKFTVVGGLGALVDFGTFNLLISLFGVPPILANMVSFSAAVTSNFTWNRYWTYPDSRGKNMTAQLGQFALVNLIGLLIRTPIFAVLHLPLQTAFEKTPLALPLSSEVLGNNLALAAAVGTVLFWNFFVNRYWTYSDVE